MFLIGYISGVATSLFAASIIIVLAKIYNRLNEKK